MDVKTDIGNAVGLRVVADDGFKGTVLFDGCVEGYNGRWLGVDWDDENRGKHNGTINEKQYFRARTAKSGSLVRRNKIKFGVTLMEAVYERYGEIDLTELATGCMVSNKEIELVGMEKSLNKTKNPSKLLCIVLDGLNVCHAGDIGDQLSRCTEIDLNNNLISDWIQVLKVLDQVKKMNFINISNNWLKNLDLKSGSQEWEYPLLLTLLMHSTGLDWKNVRFALNYFPNLRDLGLSGNKICEVTVPHRNLNNLVQLDLEGNPIKDWLNLCALFSLPKLESLNLNGTGIAEVKYIDGSFPALKILFLRNCKLNSWHSVAELSKLPKLMHLLVHDNPIMASENLATAKQIVIASMPNLAILDREEITQSERRGAEIDYLKRYAREWLGLISTGDTSNVQKFYDQHPTYKHLVSVYGPPEECELSDTKALTLQSKLIKAKICLSNGKVVDKPILSSMTVAKLKTLVARLDKRQDPRSFRLKFIPMNKPGLCMELDREFREVDFYSLSDNDTIHIDEPLQYN